MPNLKALGLEDLKHLSHSGHLGLQLGQFLLVGPLAVHGKRRWVAGRRRDAHRRNGASRHLEFNKSKLTVLKRMDGPKISKVPRKTGQTKISLCQSLQGPG